jgi:hypothetical protein
MLVHTEWRKSQENYGLNSAAAAAAATAAAAAAAAAVAVVCTHTHTHTRLPIHMGAKYPFLARDMIIFLALYL